MIVGALVLPVGKVGITEDIDHAQAIDAAHAQFRDRPPTPRRYPMRQVPTGW